MPDDDYNSFTTQGTDIDDAFIDLIEIEADVDDTEEDDYSEQDYE